MMFLLAVTVVSLLLAAIMSAIAWRMSADERRRAQARIAALAAEIRAEDTGDAAPLVLGDLPIKRVAEDPMPAIAIFTARRSSSDARPLAIVGGGALVFGTALALAIVSSGRFSGMTPPRTMAATAPASAAAPPLELIALGDERVGDQLTVRGIVRNPAAGPGVNRLTAVVLLFTPDGGFLESGRADVDAAPLVPGGESTFAITVPRAADAARYRVSFRTDDRVVPHLDRRHES